MALQWLILFTILSLTQISTTSPIYSSRDQNDLSSKIQNTNVFNSLSIKKPDGWYTLSSEELYGGYPNIFYPITINYNMFNEKFVKKYPQPITPLFGYMEYPFGTQNDKFNPSIIGIVMNMTGQTSIDNDCDLFIYLDQLRIGQPMVILSKIDCREVDINEQRLTTQELTMNIVGAFIIKQIQYVKRLNKDYFLVFTLTYSDQRDRKKLENIMRTLTFLQ